MTRRKQDNKEIEASHVEEENPWIGFIVGLILIFGAVFVYNFLIELQLDGGNSAIYDSALTILFKLGIHYIVPVVVGMAGIYNIVISGKGLFEKYGRRI